MANIFLDNFDSDSAGNLNGQNGWDVDSGHASIVINTNFPQSGTQNLWLAGTGTIDYLSFATNQTSKDGNGGNASASIWFAQNLGNSSAANYGGVTCRIQNTTWATFTGYLAIACSGVATNGFQGVSLYRYNSGTAVQLGSTVSGTNIAEFTYYQLTVVCNGSAISVQVFNGTDYLDSTGAFSSSTPISCISVADGSPITGQGYAGVTARCDAGNGAVALDTFAFSTVGSPSPPAGPGFPFFLQAMSGGFNTGYRGMVA